METAMFCDFCGKHQDYIRYLIAGPKTHICNECISLCNEIISECEAGKNLPPPPNNAKVAGSATNTEE